MLKSHIYSLQRFLKQNEKVTYTATCEVCVLCVWIDCVGGHNNGNTTTAHRRKINQNVPFAIHPEKSKNPILSLFLAVFVVQ